MSIIAEKDERRNGLDEHVSYTGWNKLAANGKAELPAAGAADGHKLWDATRRIKWPCFSRSAPA